MTNALPVLDGLTDAQIARYTERFWLKVDRSGGPEACWPFTDATLFGYGVFRVGKRKVKAHRFAYVVTYGVEPVGTLDHDCHSPEWCSLPNDADCPHRRCCNPKHVTDRSQAQNAARGNPRYRQLASAEACARGHEYTPENTHYTAEGWRQCRACSAERARLARAGTPPEPTGEARTHCRSGRHEWVDANTYTDHGVRKCRLCANEAKARYKARQKETQGT